MACICYKTSSGKASHPIEWRTVASFPRNEAGFHAALRQESLLLDSPLAHRIINARDDDCRSVWMIQQCRPWKCCLTDHTWYRHAVRENKKDLFIIFYITVSAVCRTRDQRAWLSQEGSLLRPRHWGLCVSTMREMVLTRDPLLLSTAPIRIARTGPIPVSPFLSSVCQIIHIYAGYQYCFLSRNFPEIPYFYPNFFNSLRIIVINATRSP